MITRKDLKEYPPTQIYNTLLYIVKNGMWTIIGEKYYPDDELLQMLVHTDGNQLMQIIRGYARYGKK